MRIELNCAACGRNHFSLDGDIADESRIRCKDCGHEIGTMAELKQKVAAEVMRRAAASSASP